MDKDEKKWNEMSFECICREIEQEKDKKKQNERLFDGVCREIEQDIRVAIAPFCYEPEKHEICSMEDYFSNHKYSYEVFFYNVLIGTLKMLQVVLDNDSSNYKITQKTQEICVNEMSIHRLKEGYLNRNETHKKYMNVNRDIGVKMHVASVSFYDFLCGHKSIKDFLHKENYGTLGVSDIIREFNKAYDDIKGENYEWDYYTKVDMLYEIEKNSFIQLFYHMLRGLKSYKSTKRADKEKIQTCLHEIADLTKNPIVGDDKCWECVARFWNDKPKSFSKGFVLFYENIIRIYEKENLFNSMQYDTNGIIFGRNEIYNTIEKDFDKIYDVKKSFAELNFVRQAVIYCITYKYLQIALRDVKEKKQTEKWKNRFIEVAHCEKSLNEFEKFYNNCVIKDFEQLKDCGFTHTHFKKLYLMPIRQSKK